MASVNERMAEKREEERRRIRDEEVKEKWNKLRNKLNETKWKRVSDRKPFKLVTFFCKKKIGREVLDVQSLVSDALMVFFMMP